MDKIYYNGDILTMEDTRTEPEAVLISDGIIAFTGSLKEAVRAAHQPEMTDLNGKTLMPAFIDDTVIFLLWPNFHSLLICPDAKASQTSKCA